MSWLGKLHHKYFKCFSKCMKITPCCVHVFLNGTKGSKRGAKKWKTTPGGRQLGKEVSVWWSSVGYSNDCKSPGVEKAQFLEDYHWRFGQNCWMMIRRSATCWCVKTSPSIFKLNQTCFVESLMVIRHGFLRMTWIPGAIAVSQICFYHSGFLDYCLHL